MKTGNNYIQGTQRVKKRGFIGSGLLLATRHPSLNQELKTENFAMPHKKGLSQKGVRHYFLNSQDLAMVPVASLPVFSLPQKVTPLYPG